MISVDSNSNLTAAADIGGTQIRAALVTHKGEILSENRDATMPERGIKDATSRLSELLHEVTSDADAVTGLAVSTAGPIDPATGTYDHPPNLTGWHGKSMKPDLERLTSLPVAIGHDATLAALAENQVRTVQKCAFAGLRDHQHGHRRRDHRQRRDGNRVNRAGR